MKKIASVAASVAAFAALAMASGASAQATSTWTPQPADGWYLSGSLNVQQSITLACGVTGRAKTTSSVAGEITSFGLTGGMFNLCNTLGISSLPWVIEPLVAPPSGTTAAGFKGVRIKNLYVTSTLGYCQGDVLADFDEINQTLIFNSGTFVPGYVGSTYTPCYLDGQVTLTPTGAGSNTFALDIA